MEQQRMVGAAPQKAAEAKPKSSFRTVKLRELGNKLPVGLSLANGALQREFDFRVFKTSDERTLGRLVKNNTKMHDYVATVIAYMFNRIGPFNFTEKEMSIPEKKMQLNRLYMGDVLYAYIMLRIDAIGEKLDQKIACKKCEEEFVWSGDLYDVDVTTVDKEEDLLWTYELKRPVKIRGVEVKKVRASTAHWSVLSTLEQGNEHSAKIAAVGGAICGLNDDPTFIQLEPEEIDELHKRDFEGICARINDRFAGPSMAIEGEHTCGNQFRIAIDWSYQNFFRVSSQ